jgi:Cu/Ag efflux protein CusF
MKTIYLLVLSLSITASCTPKADVVDKVRATPSPSASGTPTMLYTIRNGDFTGNGTVIKVDLELGTVELKHEEIKTVMPAMQMEFYVSDKALLSGLKGGDLVHFTLRIKDGQETIVAISKAK